LWIVLFLGLLAASVRSLAHLESELARSTVERAQAEALADAGVFWTVHQLCDRELAKQIAVDGTKRSITLEGEPVDIFVEDEDGKININAAGEEQLTSLFAAAGLPQEKIAGAIQFVIGKRTRSSGDGSPPLFRSLDELRLIPGVDDSMFGFLEQAVTVYSQQTSVQVVTATRNALLSLPQMNAERVNAILSARATHPIMASDLSNLEGTGAGLPEKRTFTVRSVAHVGSGRFGRCAVIRLTGSSDRPYGILAWRASSQDPYSNRE
jgi:general secretion pathway protein K